GMKIPNLFFDKWGCDVVVDCIGEYYLLVKRIGYDATFNRVTHPCYLLRLDIGVPTIVDEF
ncbi:MAG: hypothetical protein M0R48_11035, partial [Candidatus Omnitrophica bacterium]|nr:hypothetical protein [Candidatus Omnitrophota bacterium]